MNHLTNLYRHRAEQLQEQVNMLEAMLKDLHEATPTAPKYGTEKRQSGSGMGDSDKPIAWTGGTVHSNKAWSQSSGGPAIADSEAGDKEIESRMRNLKKTGLFGAEISDDKQSAEYRELKGEQDRRKAARAAGSQPAKAPVPAKQTSSGSGTASAVPSAKKVDQTQQTADNTGKTTALPTNVTKSGMGLTDEDGRPISVSPKPAPAAPAKPNTGKEAQWSMDPKLTLLGIGGGLYAGNKAIEWAKRQRGTSPKPAEAPKVGETTKPAEAPKASETAKPKAPEAPKVGEPGSYSTRDGKVVTPKKGAPSVAERSAMGRDALRARMAQKTGNPMSFEGPKVGAPEAPDMLRVEPNQAAAEAKWGVEKANAAVEAPAEWRTSGQMNTRSVSPEAAANWVERPLDFDASGKPSETFPRVGGRQNPNSKAGMQRAKNTPLEASFGEPPAAPAAAEAAPKAGSYSTADGKVVSPKSTGKAVGGKIIKLGAGFAGMMGADATAADTAKAVGFGKTDSALIGAAGSLAPMAASAGTNAAIATGYVAGRLIDKASEASGLSDLQRSGMQKAANWWTADQRKGVSSTEEASKAAAKTAEQAKTARSRDAEKGFASPEEAEEFAKKMKDPEFRRRQQHAMGNAANAELEKQEGGYAFAARGLDAMTGRSGDWLDQSGEAVEKATTAATDWTKENIPGAKWVGDKASNLLGWLGK